MAEHDDELRIRLIADPNIEGWVRALIRDEIRAEREREARAARAHHA